MELVEVYTATNEVDAEMLKSLLEEEGIPAMIRSDTSGGYGELAVILGSQVCGSVHILVRKEDAEQAQKIVSEVRFESDSTEEDEFEDG